MFGLACLAWLAMLIWVAIRAQVNAALGRRFARASVVQGIALFWLPLSLTLAGSVILGRSNAAFRESRGRQVLCRVVTALTMVCAAIALLGVPFLFEGEIRE